MKQAFRISCLCLALMHAICFAGEDALVEGPFHSTSEPHIVSAYSRDHYKVVRVDLSTFGPLATQACSWLLAPTKDSPLHRPMVVGPLNGDHIYFKGPNGEHLGSIVLQFEHDESLALRAGLQKADMWTLYVDPKMQLDFPDLQSWNNLFSVEGNLTTYIPGYFRAVVKTQETDPNHKPKERHQGILNAIDYLRGKTVRSMDSPFAQSIEAFGKLTSSGFDLTTIIMTLDLPRKSGSQVVIPKFALIHGKVEQVDQHYEIVDTYGKRFRIVVYDPLMIPKLRTTDMSSFKGKWVVAQGELDDRSGLPLLSILDGASTSFILQN